MSTTEKRPPQDVCTHTREEGPVQVLAARDVPLGGPRAMTVRRTLPNRHRSFVGAWCFVDHYGPDDVSATGGMDVPPHPHTGLQTVTWLFDGEIEHRDSGGHHAMVRPGAVNLMTGGSGVCHSEVTTAATRSLHGVQFWVVLPEADRDVPRAFEHHDIIESEPAPGVALRVFIGSLGGDRSPVRTATPLLGAQVCLAAGTSWGVDVDPTHEHAVLVDHGEVDFCGASVAPHDLGVVDAGRRRLTFEARTDTLLVLLGGEPYDEEIVMWWNFVGRDHDEIERFRGEWEARSDRFGEVEGYAGDVERLPAPALPGVRLRPRGRLGRR